MCPFLTSIAGLPMYMVAGTSALAVSGQHDHFDLHLHVRQRDAHRLPVHRCRLVGIFIGSILGPYTSKYIPDRWLKRIFVVLAVYVGVGYTLRGFLDIRISGNLRDHARPKLINSGAVDARPHSERDRLWKCTPCGCSLIRISCGYIA